MNGKISPEIEPGSRLIFGCRDFIKIPSEIVWLLHKMNTGAANSIFLSHTDAKHCGLHKIFHKIMTYKTNFQKVA